MISSKTKNKHSKELLLRRNRKIFINTLLARSAFSRAKPTVQSWCPQTEFNNIYNKETKEARLKLCKNFLPYRLTIFIR